MTRLILATGPIYAENAIVIDHDNCCFWIGADRRPHSTNKHGINRRFRMIATMLIRSPGIITWDEMVDAIWGDDWNGGPEDPKRYLLVSLTQTRGLQRWLGGVATTSYGFGVRFEFASPAKLLRAA